MADQMRTESSKLSAKRDKLRLSLKIYIDVYIGTSIFAMMTDLISLRLNGWMTDFLI